MKALRQLDNGSGLLISTAPFESFVKDDNKHANQGNDAKYNKGYGKRIHLSTSLPSRKWPNRAKTNPMTIPKRSPAELKLSGLAKGPTTRRVKVTLDMSQKNFARLSFCFSVRRIFMGRFYSVQDHSSSQGVSQHTHGRIK